MTSTAKSHQDVMAVDALRKVAALAGSKGSSKEWPWLVPPSIVMWGVVLGAAVAIAAAEPPTAFPLCTPPAAWAAIAAGMAVSAAVAMADAVLDAGSWSWLGGFARSKISSTEPARELRFVMRPMNTHSSNALVAAGVFVLARTPHSRRALTSAVYGGSLIAVGGLSYAWWASRRRLAQRADNLFMEVSMVALGAHMAALAMPPSTEPWIVAAVAAATVIRGWTFLGEAALPQCILLLWASVLFAVARVGGIGALERLAVGWGLTLASVIAKAADVLDGYRWGTAVFHYLAGLSHVCLFLWAQTLPPLRE